MSARRKFQHPEALATSSTPSGRLGSKDAPNGGENVIEDVRSQWVQDRREELDRVFDTHDTLVCSPDFIARLTVLIYPRSAKPSIWRSLCRCSPMTQRYVLFYNLSFRGSGESEAELFMLLLQIRARTYCVSTRASLLMAQAFDNALQADSNTRLAEQCALHT